MCGDNYFKTPYANVDEIIIWDTILSDEFIQNYDDYSLDSEDNNIVSFWNFNEGSGDTVYDISGNGNDGVINGATYSEDVPEQNCFSNELSISNDFTFLGSLDSSYYYLSNNFHTWQEAQLICNSLGGDLLTITDEDESDYITSILDINSNTVIVNIGFWIGLQLIDDVCLG